MKIQPAPTPSATGTAPAQHKPNHGAASLKTDDATHSCLEDGDVCEDIGKCGRHIRRIAVGELKSLLSQATKGCVRRGLGVRQEKKDPVRCLLLSFEDDDLGLDEQMHALAQLLRERYGYEAEEWKIPGLRPKDRLTWKLQHFVDRWNGKKGTLLVLYGGRGHGNPASPSRRGLFISGTRTSGPTICWGDLQGPSLLYSPKDTLLILDWCYAANAFEEQPYPGRKDILTASGHGLAGGDDDSYTAVLTQLLASTKFPHKLTPEVIHRKLASKSERGDGGLKFLPNHCGYPAADGHQIELVPKVDEWVKVGLRFRGPLDLKEFREWLDKEIATLIGPVSVKSKSFSTAGTIVLTMPAFLWDYMDMIEYRIDVVVKKLERRNGYHSNA